MRNLLLGMIEPIEISIRSKIAQYLAVAGDPLAYRTLPTLWIPPITPSNWRRLIPKSRKAVNRKYYGGSFPIWVAIEMMSFGSVSKMYSNLVRTHRQHIAKPHYGLNEQVISQWLRSLKYLRSLCPSVSPHPHVSA